MRLICIVFTYEYAGAFRTTEAINFSVGGVTGSNFDLKLTKIWPFRFPPELILEP